MGMFLNSIVPHEEYKAIVRTRFFVDKSFLIDEIISTVMMDGQRYFCITRPRRFGKSVMANMVGAFLAGQKMRKRFLMSLSLQKAVIIGNICTIMM